MRLDNEYRIESDNVGSTLIYEQPRCREVNGYTEEFIYTDRWYFQDISQALNRYVDLKLGKATDVKEMLNLIKELKEQLKK